MKIETRHKIVPKLFKFSILYSTCKLCANNMNKVILYHKYFISYLLRQMPVNV